MAPKGFSRLVPVPGPVHAMVPAASSSSASSGSHLTDAPEIPRVSIGTASEHLHHEMLKMYWDGVRRELPHLILTLRRWQTKEEYASTVLPDERDSFIHGYDTFLDQVSHNSRQFSGRNNSSLDRIEALENGERPKKKDEPPPSYASALENRGWDVYAEMKSASVKYAIRASLDAAEPDVPDVLRRRAKMLLQSAQFLDIDKLIEFRDPERLVSFWKRPATPQLTASSYDETHMPHFAPQLCSYCHNVIRGSMFQRVPAAGETQPQGSNEEVIICEGCYRKKHYSQPGWAKQYKHCCLAQTVSPALGRKICQCIEPSRRDKRGRLKPMFPIQSEEDRTGHLNPSATSGRARCGLFELTDRVAEAKYAATRLKLDTTEATLEEERREGMAEVRRLEADNPRMLRHIAVRPSKLPNIHPDGKPGTLMMAEFGTSYGHTTRRQENIPRYLQTITDNYPYGNVHMALRVGPLIIENGVDNTKGGALVTARDPPNLQILRDSPDDIQHSLLLTGQTNRKLYSQSRPRAPKRYKAVMKQVAGGAFCSFFDTDAEDDIINLLVEESRHLVDQGISAAQKATLLDQSVGRLMAKLRPYLESRIEAYIGSIAARLVDPAVELRWNFQTNNCQMFCDNLLNRDLFGALLAPHDDNFEEIPLGGNGKPPSFDYGFSQNRNGKPNGFQVDGPPNGKSGPNAHLPTPLYLMSFVCRPGAYVMEKARSKYDVPNGLTEEYLLKFRYGRHDDSDVLDSLSEYWTDWGSFGGPIYRYQDVFPWDCTEAYDRYPVRCGDCNIAKHVWAFPFDSWSAVSLHLARGRHLYPPSTTATEGESIAELGTNAKKGGKGPSKANGNGVAGPSSAAGPANGPSTSGTATGVMSDTDWFRNRLTVLLAQDTLLTAAVAMARCGPFREATLWLHSQDDETRDRLKMGGIHRAQPFSHHFEKGAYHQYFVAEWALLSRPLKIAAYETLRDWRATREDVEDSADSSDGGGGGGCGGFLCGIAMGGAGCAAGFHAGAGEDTCGSGCVSSCGGGDGDGGGCGGCGGCGG